MSNQKHKKTHRNERNCHSVFGHFKALCATTHKTQNKKVDTSLKGLEMNCLLPFMSFPLQPLIITGNWIQALRAVKQLLIPECSCRSARH